jgi:hypothetical protein
MASVNWIARAGSALVNGRERERVWPDTRGHEVRKPCLCMPRISESTHDAAVKLKLNTAHRRTTTRTRRASRCVLQKSHTPPPEPS